MKHIFLTSFLSFSAILCFAQSQSEMNAQSVQDLKKADSELNTVYNKILKEYSSQAVFITNLKKAQRLWVQLRDAEMDAKFPASQQSGSVSPMCRNVYKTGLTEERTKKLKVWLDGIPEGDVCNGSVKTQ